MTSNDQHQKGPGAFDTEPRYQPGRDPAADAWYTAFFIENHLDHLAYPDHVATPEQVRFTVYTEDNERYYPCSDRMFWTIMKREDPPYLKEKYDEVLHKVLSLIEHQIEDEWEKAYLKALVKTKYEHETRDGIMIPSRLEKRLLKIYINRTQIEDPYLCEKARRNKVASWILSSETFLRALDHVDDSVLLSSPVSLEQVKEVSQLDLLAQILPERVGAPLSINNLREDLSVAFETAERWVTILENLYFCFRIQPYGLPRLRAAARLYGWPIFSARAIARVDLSKARSG